MGRQHKEPTAHSSIALLQERFRQLQRVKEMREERELLRVFAEAERPAPSARCEQPKWFIHPDLVHPSRPLHGPPSLRLQPHGDRRDFQAYDTQLSIGLWSNRANMHSSKNPNGTDVDTSLHL